MASWLQFEDRTHLLQAAAIRRSVERATAAKHSDIEAEAEKQMHSVTTAVSCLSYPEWHGWHAARRGLGSNLYRLGVPEMVIQRILRHANVSTTATYYIKTAADDVRNAMAKLETQITVTSQTQSDTNGTLTARVVPQPRAIQ